MALKHKYANAAEIPAELKTLYVERDGAWYLDAERDPLVEEMRTNNVNLLKENATWKQRFAGIDPEAVRKLAEEKSRLEEEQRLKDGKFQDVLNEKIKAAVGPVAAERDEFKAKLSVMMIDNTVRDLALKRGLRPTAVPDLLARARTSLRLVGGVVQVFDGENVRMGKDGFTPMNPAEWVDALPSDAPHLFDANAGGGAVGSGAGGSQGGGGQVNWWSKATWNLTEQAKLMKSNPALAARLEASA
ncbi:MAG: hypothetical protein WCH99_05455 [Verrucomicrobiota bacterium]